MEYTYIPTPEEEKEILETCLGLSDDPKYKEAVQSSTHIERVRDLWSMGFGVVLANIPFEEMLSEGLKIVQKYDSDAKFDPLVQKILSNKELYDALTEDDRFFLEVRGWEYDDVSWIWGEMFKDV